MLLNYGRRKVASATKETNILEFTVKSMNGMFTDTHRNEAV